MVPTPAVQIENLSKTFQLGVFGPRVQALRGINLQVPVGSVYGLLGPNGSGKSTTLKILLGLQRPDTGRALIFGRPGHLREARSMVGFLPESPCFHRFLTGRESLQFYAQLSGLSPIKANDRVAEVLAMIKLGKAAERTLSTYSKGMLQRIGLGQALLHDPSLIILDEPSSGMDAEGVEELSELIQSLHGRGKTIILCSHILSEVESLCTHLCILKAGRVLLQGHLDSLRRESGRLSLQLQDFPPERIADLQAWLHQEGMSSIDIQIRQEHLKQIYLRTIRNP